IAARAVAAERANASLVLDGVRLRLHDDAAEASLRAALAALRIWNTAEAKQRLDAAGTRAVDPALQQRIGIWRLLVGLVEQVVRVEPEQELRGEPERWALDYLRGADRLAEAERDYYRAEVARLVAERVAAEQDPASTSAMLWYVLRARRALAADEPLAALIWLLRVARVTAERLPGDEYLGNLLERARTLVRLELGDVPAEEVDAAREAAKGLQAWDVYRALTARLGEALGVDVQRETARFNVRPYRSAEEEG
ncbi:MAG: hypothetical protein M3O34_08715, partial [Chloroflexota bacterium]|nr:hypothetical protein [Chloroflexota bacterium]